MGASVVAYWPGITDEQIESMPGFRNDDKAWGNWMADREDHPQAIEAIKRLDAGAILSFKTDGWDDDDVAWTTPDELQRAAQRLRDAVQNNTADAAAILKSYQKSANGIEALAQEFVRDLDDVIAIAKWSAQQGAVKLTLEVNW
jgi:hypothetical protein